ncbi:MAG: Holliday junction resolvase RuvX [Flavobacteriales bacterium]|nr:Holliday junction resolvase RuvX [Flavobacteriales bacterium]MDG2247212.1 Holliday junction resolvase RuvX [Flavobacteriales bacterium]
MGKALAFDFGVKRTGLAITDELQIIASPLEGVSTEIIWDKIAELVASGKISDFVVGDPSFLGETNNSEPVRKFITKLRKEYPAIPIHEVDESFSSRDAMSAMVQGGMKKSKRRDKKTLDMISATVILQRYLGQ